MASANELVQQAGESGAQIDNDASGTLPVAVGEVISLMTSLEKANEEAVNAKAELAEFRASAESVAKEHQAASAKMREKRQGELESWKVVTSQGEAVFSQTCAKRRLQK